MLQSPRMNRTSWIALLAEFGPLISFFVAGRLTSFFDAVAVLMATTVVAVVLSWKLDQRIPFLPIISAFFVLIGGCVTLYFREPQAIIFADTLYYLTIVGVLGISFYREKLILKRLFHTVFALTDAGWHILSWRWFWFLLLATLANEIARHVLTPEAWIDYRFFKSVMVTLFALYQFTLAEKYRIGQVSNRFGLRTKKEDIVTPSTVLNV
jgi:intracellular septation protein